MMQAWRVPAMALAIAPWTARGALCALAAVIAIGLAVPAQADTLDDARQTVDQTTREGAQSQDRVDALDDEAQEVITNYRAVLRQVEDLRAYNEQRQTLIDAQEEEKTSLREQIERVQTIERDIVPLTEEMIDTLGEFIQADVPFQIEERTNRITRLNETFDRADISIAEKFRLVLEAYQIENDYGRTIEAYAAKAEIDGEERELDFLMIGRVAFFYQTFDEQETAVWDQENRRWIQLESRYAGPVRLAMNMARELIPPELLILPVTGPETAEE